MSSGDNSFTAAAEISVRRLVSQQEFAQAHVLYRDVFSYSDPSLGVNPRLMTTLIENGGTAIGAFTPEPTPRLVGFTYGYPGVDAAGHRYHYSQAAVVDPELQGQGIGRILKVAQGDVARSAGATHMRWSFDPALARNAHFNLNSLGANGRWFSADPYGVNSDRMTVEWALVRDDTAPVAPEQTRVRPSQSEWGIPITTDGAILLPIPAQFTELDQESADRVRVKIRAALTELLSSGAVAVTCDRIDSTTAMYFLVMEPRA